MIHEERDQHLRSFYGDDLIDRLYKFAHGVDPANITQSNDDGKVYVDFDMLLNLMGLPNGLLTPVQYAYWVETGGIHCDVPWGSVKSGWKSAKYEKRYNQYVQTLFTLKSLEGEFKQAYLDRYVATTNAQLQYFRQLQQYITPRREPNPQGPQFYIHSVKKS